MMHPDIRNTLAWIVTASFVMFLAVWQAQVTAARDLEARKRELPPPARTRHAVRPEVLPWAGDPVADYVARCEKGLTDREIGWILEDFHNAGLTQLHPWDDIFQDLPNPSPTAADVENFMAYTSAQTHWYRKILRDGFRLSPQQSAELSLKLGTLLGKSQATFIGFMRNGFPKTTGAMGGEWTQLWHPWSGLYLDSPECHPWNLCSLTPAQEKLTWKSWYDLMERDDLSFDDPALPDMRLPRSENPELLFLHPSPILPSTNAVESPRSVLDAERIFPFLKSQKFIRLPNENDPFVKALPDHRRIFLENISHLHPAQLETLLLLTPNMAAEIQQILDSESH